VPAQSEFVFEGYIYPDVREIEGGFGEYTGYYGEARSNPVFEITAITHRNNPIYLGTREQWYPSESSMITGRTSQAKAYKTLKSIVPGLLDLRCNVTYEAIAKIDKLFKDHPQQVMDAIWGSTSPVTSMLLWLIRISISGTMIETTGLFPPGLTPNGTLTYYLEGQVSGWIRQCHCGRRSGSLALA